MTVTFTAKVFQPDGMDATGMVIPPEVITQLGGTKRPPVVVSFKGYSYRNTVAVYGDQFLLGIAKEHRAAAGVKAGDVIEVTLELDTEPRTVEVPADLADALAKKPGAREAFDKLAYSKRKEFVRQVLDAKAVDTRQRRIVGIVEKM